MTIGIYCIENLIDGKKYIGKSINIEKRISKHFWGLRQTVYDLGYEKPNRHLWNAAQKHGVENFEYRVIESFDSIDEKLLADREVYWMDFHNTLDRNLGYNLMRDSSSKVVVSEETKQLISTINKGRVRSEQARINGSLAKIGEKNPMYGVCGEAHHNFKKIFSGEALKNMSESHLRFSYEQRTREGTLIKLWDSITDLKESGLFTIGRIYDASTGFRKSHKGFIWVKVERNTRHPRTDSV